MTFKPSHVFAQTMSSFTKLPNQKKTHMSVYALRRRWLVKMQWSSWRTLPKGCPSWAKLHVTWDFFRDVMFVVSGNYNCDTPETEKMADGSRKRPSFLASGVEVRCGSKLSGCVSNHMDKHVLPNPTCCLQTRTVPRIYVASLRLLLFQPDFSIDCPIGSHKLPV